jgi:hypothetical protein
MDALGQVGGGPVLGLIGTLRSLQAALVVAGIALTPSLPLVLLARWHGRGVDTPMDEPVGAPEEATVSEVS